MSKSSAHACGVQLGTGSTVAPALAAHGAYAHPYRFIDPPQFSGGQGVAGPLLQKSFDFLNPQFKLTVEQTKAYTQEAEQIMGFVPGRNFKNFKQELDRLGLEVEGELALEDDYYQNFQQGLKWKSYRIKSEGHHWLNHVVQELEKSGWPVDLYLDPALLTVNATDAMTFQNTRRGRVGLFLFSDLIYNKQAPQFPHGGATFLDAHEWIHVLFELSRRGVISYHPKSPVNMFMISRGPQKADNADYGRVLYFEEMTTYAQQASLTRTYPEAQTYSQKMVLEISNQVLNISANIKKADWSKNQIVKQGPHRYLKVGDEEKDFALYIWLPADLPENSFEPYVKLQLENAEKLAHWNQEHVHQIPGDQLRREQIHFVDQLKEFKR